MDSQWTDLWKLHGYYLWIVSMMENAWKDDDVLQQANTVGVQVVKNVWKMNGTSDGEGNFPPFG